ncbi:hypothetical protein AFAEC_1178 [Aliarcobacter faecis]|uniref:hypothetical protein n=1 Tax=Aliarcobacter faecis TaxID=1564138 RepID=UPI0004799255|nr:hypothetical protein [Aliarcobacter faecis]QKF73343.1 hypothetical protein AFAEC_1178 [Aliarcobacter faecis]
MEKRVICQKCIYYYVTWEAGRGHGCKAYGFKSGQIPSVVVKRSSGQDCKFYRLKNFEE